MANTPNIRFKGFTDTWQQRKLEEIAGNVIGGGTPKTSVAEYWDGSIPWIQSSNIQENEMFEFEIPKSITQLGLDKSVAKLIPKNSIAVVTHVGVGKLVFVPFSYATSQDFTSLAELKTDAKFTCYSLYQRIQNDLHIVQGSAIKGITKEDLLAKEIMVPEIEEQAKIGDYFRNLDHLITLHQRKCDETKELKKYMLQKMFPKNGEKIPEIRFTGFTGDWEQRKLEEIVDVCSGRDYKHLGEGDIPVYGTGGYMLSVSEALSEKDDAIGIGRKGTIDNPYILRAPFWTVDTLFYCIPKKDFDLDFVFGIYQNINWKAMDESTGVPSLSKTAINNVAVMAPSINEQVKLGGYFTNLDHLITLHQRKCDDLKEVKKFMLQNMFPQKG